MAAGTIIIELTLDGKQFTAGIKDATGNIEGMGQQANQTSSAVEGLGKSLQSLAVQAAIIAAIYKIGDAMKDIVAESTLLAARVETLGLVMATVGGNVGLTAQQMENYAKNVAEMGITTQVSRETVIRMVQAQMDLTKATDLARISQDAAVIGNTNSSAALEKMIYGIQTGQVEVLKTIGLNVNFENSYNKLAAQLGKNAESLTEIEKTQARTNVVLEAGERIAGTYEAAMGTVGKQLNTMPRYIEEVKLQFGELFKPALTVIVAEMNSQLKDMGAWFKRGAETGEVTAWAERIKFAAEVGMVAVSDFGRVLKGIYDSFQLGAAAALYLTSGIYKMVQGYYSLKAASEWLLGGPYKESIKTAEQFGKDAADMIGASSDLVNKVLDGGMKVSTQSIALKNKEMETAKAVYKLDETITQAQRQLKETLIKDIAGLEESETGKFLAEYDKRYKTAGSNAGLIKKSE